MRYVLAILLIFSGYVERPDSTQGSESDSAVVSVPLLPGPTTRSARLVFAGDVMSHEPQVTAARTAATRPAKYDYSEVFRHFRPIFEGADVAVANLETTLRTAPPYTGYPAFAAPAELAFDLHRAGIRIVTTANNHICDKGAAGVRSTLAALDSAGLRHTGVFLDSVDRLTRHPLRFEAGGLRFALLAYTYGINGPSIPRGVILNTIDTAAIARDLALVRTGEYDAIIISYHWGEEYKSQPIQAQRRLAEWTHAHGADIVIGSHPHVVEPIEPVWNTDSTRVVGATYYSLGNFVSNQRQRRTDGGIVADITVTRVDPPVTYYSLSTLHSSATRYSSSGGRESSIPYSLSRVLSSAAPSTSPSIVYWPSRSLPVRRTFDFGWRLAWVDASTHDGRRRYEVMPAAALDSLPEPARTAARRFASDTRKLLLSDPAVSERQ
jgi:poly-gamma-glutamate synthesis protein (capsule biosynthesis protein)